MCVGSQSIGTKFSKEMSVNEPKTQSVAFAMKKESRYSVVQWPPIMSIYSYPSVLPPQYHISWNSSKARHPENSKWNSLNSRSDTWASTYGLVATMSAVLVMWQRKWLKNTSSITSKGVKAKMPLSSKNRNYDFSRSQLESVYFKCTVVQT